MKLIILVVVAVLILAWIVWDRTAHWIYMIRGECGDYWISAECSRCGHIEEVAEIDKLPKVCPACGRRMK